MAFPQALVRILLVGVGATAVLDLWLAFLTRVGVPTLSFALVGRWVGHLPRGTLAHQAIARSEPVRGELALGWLCHYATGIAFAALLLSTQGAHWAREPSLTPAMTVGLGTVLLPLLLMQPAMGAGVAARRTATPVKNVLRSLANHAVFGVGLYLSSLFAAQALR